MSIHVRRHSGVRPYMCTHPECTYGATRADTLLTHIRSHTGERPFVCGMPGCDYAAAQRSVLTKHKRRKHQPD